MAGRGRAPKPKSERRNRAEPRRGDWTDLVPTTREKPPELPARGAGRGGWSPRTRRAWGNWWSDPASTQWSESDVDLVEQLADVYEEWVRKPTSGMASEVRQLRDSLGLTPKGRQDRRWRIAPAAEVVELEQHRSAAERMAEMRKRAARAGR